MNKALFFLAPIMIFLLAPVAVFADGDVFNATVKGVDYTVAKAPGKYVGNYLADNRYDWKYTLNSDGTGSFHMQTTDARGSYYWDANDVQKITRWGVAVQDGVPLTETKEFPAGTVESETIVYEVEACSTGHGTCADPGLHIMNAYVWNGKLTVASAAKQ